MTHETKVTVSAGELAVASDKGIILTKRVIIEKSSVLFSSLVPAINEIFGNILSLNKGSVSSMPKISKGENYRGFPYVILDHPASFEKGNIFAVRTMFLWGHYFSIQLHLSGRYKIKYQENLLRNLHNDKDFFIAAGEKEWEHHFENDNYIRFLSLSKELLKEIREKEFLKIALKYELHEWNRMQSMLPEGYRKINDLLNP